MSFDTASESRFTVFQGERRLARGTRPEVLAELRARGIDGPTGEVWVYDDATGKLIDLDFRPSPAGEGSEAGRGPGRPKLGVVAREVTLLPRHWEWLSRQPGGASVALRKLVEDARRSAPAGGRQREAREAAYCFMQSAAGDRPGFEEATRALFAGERESFAQRIAGWPVDLRDHATELAAAAW